MSLVAALNSGVSALNTFSRGIQIISNNIANVSTTGFKESSASYSDSFSNLLQQAAPSSASGIGSNVPTEQVGTGVQVGSITGNFTQGTLTATGKNTDLAITGNGFFRVRDTANSQDFVTRAGDFRLDDKGYLVTSDGYRVQGTTGGTATYSAIDDNGAVSYVKTAVPATTIGDIQIDFQLSVGSGLTNDTGGAFTDAQVQAGKPTMRSFTIDALGNVIIGLSNGDTINQGKILLQNFRDPDALTRAGNNLYSGFEAAGPVGSLALTESENSPGTGALGGIQVGTLELSNVDLSQQFADMIVVQRSFQAGSRVVSVADSMLEEIVNLKR